MRAKELLQLIPEKELDILAVETKVDHQVKKLSGQVMFQLILFSMISKKRVSLRVMEELLKSSTFRTLSSQSKIDAKYNSLSDRIATINADYFESIFYTVFDKFSKYLNEENTITRYDSTMVAVSSKLFKWGMKVGRNSKADKRQLKFTIGMHGSLPSSLQIFSEQTYLAEDIALKEAILNDPNNQETPVVFDRGLKSKNTFEKFSNDNILFVTRCNSNFRYLSQQTNSILEKPLGSTITIIEDLTIKITHRHTRESSNQYRLIKAYIDETKEEIWFLSNMLEMTGYEIAAIYKQRWDIEILFKFLKHELNISHLVSRNLNGIKVIMYMSLITAILVIAFRKLNKISSYKIAKLRFELELDNLAIGQIVIMCGGDFGKFQSMFDT